MLNIFYKRCTLAAMMAGLTCMPIEHGRAQAPAPLQHQSWSTGQGLPQSSVHQILQSQDGYLWLATEGGVVRYDGASFKVFSHETDPSFTSNDVTSLAQDRAGNLWFGTADGLVRDANGQFRRFSESDGMPSSSILSIAASNDGSVLILTADGLVRFDGSQFKPVEAVLSPVNQLVQQADGSVILATARGLMRAWNGQFQPLVTSVSPPAARLSGALTGQNGEVWLWNEHEVLVTGPGKQSAWRVGMELPGARVQALFLDHLGAAWVGTNRGLVMLRPSSQSPKPIPALGVNSILSVMEDSEHNLWIGTETSGLHALRPRKFREEPALADDEVSCIVQATDGSMWIGTKDDGLHRLRPGSAGTQLDRPAPNSALTSPVILSLAPGLHGDVWAGTPDGLTHVEATGKTTRYTSSDGLPDDLIRSLLFLPNGTLWVGTRHGLAHLQAGHFDVLTQANGLGSDLIGTLFESNGPDSSKFNRNHESTHELWIATLAGLSVLSDGVFKNFTRADGLQSNLVTGVATDGANRLWVSTRDAGLFLFEGHRFLSIAAKGVPHEIFSILADQQGFLWLRGRHGVLRVSDEELARCATQTPCQPGLGVYGVEDRMPSEEIVANGDPSAWRTTNGELWFATRKGVAIADPAALPLNLVPPPVVIEHFLADTEEVPVGSGLQTIPSGHARYTFDFAGLSYTVPSKVLYRSRLEGFDQVWSNASSRRSASYTNLPPGRYTFRVQAANNDGLWNDVGAKVRFRILPPIYRRWWFVLAMLLIFGALLVLIYRLRVRRLQVSFDAVLAERNRIAREIHDTLAQDFVGVSLQLDLVTQLLARDSLQEATTQLKATRNLVKAGLEEARQSIWNLRANSAQDSLPTRLTALAQRFSTGDIVLKTRIGGAYRTLPPSLEAEVLRILQEILSNAQRHAAATVILVQLMYGQDKLVVKVEDDGCGFSVAEATAKPGHFGLQGMRERAVSLGADLNLRSSPGEGTTVELVVPVTGRKGSQR